MKSKFIFLALAMLIVGILTIGCENEPDNGTAPKINFCLTSGTLGNLQAGIEKTSFRIGDYIWFGCDTTDPDKDVVSMTISMGKIGQTPTTNTIPCSTMPYTNTLFYTAFVPEAGDQGNWSISAFVTDSKGNKSNTVINAVTVTN
jgi:hypothetical protein